MLPFIGDQILIAGIQKLYTDIFSVLCVNDYINVDKYNKFMTDIENSLCL